MDGNRATLLARLRATLSGLAARGSVRWGLCALLFVVLAYACSLEQIVRIENLVNDFRSFHLAFQAARERCDVYDADCLQRLANAARIRGQIYPYLYPPPFAYLLAPLGALKASRAQLLWHEVSLVALGVAVAAHVRTLRGALASPEGGRGVVDLVVVGALLLWMLPLRNNVNLGQVNPFVLACVMLAIHAHARGRDVASGALGAVAVAIKVTPGVLVLFWIARRRPRALVGFAAGLAAIVGASIAAGALPAYPRYLALLPKLSHGSDIERLFSAGAFFNFSLAGMFSRWIPGHPAVVRVLSLGAIAGLLAPVLRAAWRAATEAEEQLALALLVLVMVIASPLAYLHHVIYLLPAVLAWIVLGLRARRYARVAVTLLGVAIACSDLPSLYGLMHLSQAQAAIFGSMNLYALLALYAVGLVWLRDAARAREAAG